MPNALVNQTPVLPPGTIHPAPHPTSGDVHSFAKQCQIDPSFDTKYMPLITTFLSAPLPETWQGRVDPDDRWYFYCSFKPVIRQHLSIAHKKDVPRYISTWEHPLIPTVRDQVQDLISADAKKEEAMFLALNPMDPEEARIKKHRMEKRAIIKAVEVVVLKNKEMYGSPDVDDVRCDPTHHSFFTCDPLEVCYAIAQLGISVDKDVSDETGLVWIARMCALTPLPEDWDKVLVEGDHQRKYRCREWENEELVIHEPPCFKYWRTVLVAKRSEVTDGEEGLEAALDDAVDNDYDVTAFVKLHTGRKYVFDFYTQTSTFEDGGDDDPDVLADHVPEIADVHVESSDEEEEVLVDHSEREIPTEELHLFAKQCGISLVELRHNPKVSQYLIEQLHLKLPDDWVHSVIPDGVVHYYSEKKNLTMWRHPRADAVREIHERVVARRAKAELDARLKERQDKAMAKALAGTSSHVVHANLGTKNRNKTIQQAIFFSAQEPQEEAVEFYQRRYGEGADFLKYGVELVLREMNEESNDVDVTPAQVLQMAIFFGINIAKEPWLLCIAMCAVIAPIPPFWYVVMEEGEEDGARGEGSRAASRGAQVHVKVIDFEMDDDGLGGHYTQKQETQAPLLFARDVSDTATHRQEAHPSDPYWRSVVEIGREVAATLTVVERLKCCVLPFFNQIVPATRSAERSGSLYYFNFINGEPLFASESGEFVPPVELQADLPKVVGGMRAKKKGKGGGGRAGSGAGGGGGGSKGVAGETWQPIHKFDKQKNRELLKVNVSTPSFLPPIPGAMQEESREDTTNMLDAAMYLLGDVPDGEEEEGRGGEFASGTARPRTRQALTPAVEERGDRGGGALHVGFSGMERPLYLHGRSSTPWDRKDEEGRLCLEDSEFEGLIVDWAYVGGGGGKEEYVWAED